MGWREAHRRRVEELEAAAAKVMLDALGAIIDRLAARLGNTITAAASPDEAAMSLDDLAAIRAEWAAAVQEVVAPYFGGVFEAGVAAADVQLRTIGVAVPVPGPEFIDEAAARYLAQATDRFNTLGDETWERARSELLAGFRAGEGIDDLRRRVQGATGLARVDAERIARTEVISASNQGADVRVRSLGADAPPFKQWLSTLDGRTRPSHVRADGQVVPLRDPFEVGGARLAVPGDPTAPFEEVVNCLAAATRVSYPALRAATARRHDGELISVRFASGDELAGTPNHPVLTSTGWRPLGDLKEGDSCVRGGLRRELPGEPDVQHPPAEIAEVYELASRSGGSQRVSGAPVDFHGDGAYGEVEVVPVNRRLGIDVQAATDEQVMEFGLAVADHASSAQGRDDGALFRLWGAGGSWDPVPSSSVLGWLSQLPPLGGPESIHAQLHRLTARADRQAQLAEAAGDDRPGDAEVSGDPRHWLTLGVTLTEVVEVERSTGSHLVYNLDTGAGWYIANNIITGNCRCTVLYLDSPTPLDPDGRQEGGQPGVVDLVADPGLAPEPARLTGDDLYEATASTATRLDTLTANTLQDYKAVEYRNVNEKLRVTSGDLDPDTYRANVDPDELSLRGALRPRQQESLQIAADKVKVIDAAFEQAPAIGQEALAYRGVGDVAATFGTPRPGDTFIDYGYTSVTSSEAVARDFMRGTDPGRVTVTLPAETQPLNLSAAAGTAQSEQELLLPRGGTYRVTAASPGPSGWDIVMELIL